MREGLYHLAVGCCAAGRNPSFLPGVFLGCFDAAHGVFHAPNHFFALPRPSWICGDPSSHFYVVSENPSGEGSLSALAWEGGEIHLRWQAPSEGVSTCYAEEIPERGWVAAVSYSSGTLAIWNISCGRLVHRVDYGEKNSGQNPPEVSHPHQIVISPGARWLLVPDLGLDTVWAHHFDGAGFHLSPQRAIRLPRGTGPRHMVFSNAGDWAYVLGEWDGTVYAVRWDEMAGQGEVAGMSRATAPGPGGSAWASAIRMHPYLPRIYCACRHEHKIVLLDVERPEAPARITDFPACEKIPRDFVLLPNGRWLLAAGEASDGISAIPLNPKSGLPVKCPRPPRWECGSPACIRLAPIS